jgi:hypothetical protein
MFNITLIVVASLATIGIVELIKVFLPENTSAKIKCLISLVISIGATVGFGFLLKNNFQTILLSSIVTVGLVQSSYNFILKLLKSKIEDIKVRIEEESIQIPFLKKRIEAEIERIKNGEEPCDCEDCKS